MVASCELVFLAERPWGLTRVLGLVRRTCKSTGLVGREPWCGVIAPTPRDSLDIAMSKPHTWLMLLVALILPFKGTMATAGMFCHLGSDLPMSVIVQPHKHHADTPHDHAHSAGAEVASQSGVHDDVGLTPVSSSCTICSAMCSAAPLPAAGFSSDSLSAAGSERFPALVPSRLNAVSGGIERPPRTI